MILLAWLSGCATEPGPGAVFRDEVVPALERSCASGSCHGVAPGSAEAGEVVNWGLFHFPIDEAEKITDTTWTYQAAKRAINTSEDPVFSSLLRKPLSSTFGGTPHYGGENYATPDDDDYQAIYDWIAMETGGGEDPEPLSDLELLFAETVQPALQGVSCGNGNCHGSSSGVPFHLDGGVGGVVSIAGTRANYGASRKMLSLEGAPEQSRLLRKSLPLHEGGIVHKGGNDAFFDGLDDPRAQAVMDWACAEQAALLGTDCSSGPQVSGFVFVRGQVGPRDLFDLDVYEPGTDIWLASATWPALEVTETVDLTGALHGGAGDVRDPAVDTSGERMLFSMRLDPDEGHAIYVMELASGAVTQLTEPGGAMAGGGLWTDRDPTWGPDGHVWFVSTREGLIADDGEHLGADLYELDPGSGALTQRTWTAHIERRPIFLTMGKVGGEIAFTVLRDAVPGQAHAHPFRFPPDMHLEYHQHFGTTPDQNLHHDLRELADGRYLILQGDLGAAWEGGSLAVIDRNFGPEINYLSTSQEPSLPFYAPPCLMVDPDGVTIDAPGTLYRDPAGLPDGRALVATAPDVDLFDPADDVELGITVVTLSEGVDGSGPRLVGAVSLLDEPGVDEFDPEPVAILRPAPVSESLAWDPSGTTGIFYHQGMPMIDAILSNLSPSGVKTIPTDFRHARIIEALPMSLADRAPVPAEETRFGVEGATTTGLGPHGPSRIMAEFPLAADGSFQAELPAGVPFRLQSLNEDLMSTGQMHNRWYDLHPGQVLRQGVTAVDTSQYTTNCGVCHGSVGGDPAEVFLEPDVMTTASLTLSRYEDQNPRRPIPIPLIGDDTSIPVDFQGDVQPILAASCAGCHQGDDAPAGLSLTDAATTWYSDAYESLLAPGDRSDNGWDYIDASDGAAKQSYLMELLTGRELSAPGALTSDAAHPADAGGAALGDEELLIISRWIDLGATW